MGNLSRRILALLRLHPDGLLRVDIARELHAGVAKVGTQLKAMEVAGYVCLQSTLGAGDRIDDDWRWVLTTAGTTVLAQTIKPEGTA